MDSYAKQIDLPASNADVVTLAIDPAFASLPESMDTPAAKCLLLAIGRQESGFARRTQISGPARGLWQFEAGGVSGVMRHPASASYVRDLCDTHGVGFAVSLIYRALANDDVFAAGIARLLLYTDPRPLPVIGDADAAWAYYLRNWRPGSPSRDRWGDAYTNAQTTIEACA